MKKYLKIRLRVIAVLIIIIGTFSFIGHDVVKYLEWSYLVNTVFAGGSCPDQDGGTISQVYMTCIGDTPSGCPAMPTPGPCQSCNQSCPDISPKWYMYPQCTGYINIAVDAQLGTTELAPSTGFTYSGGGTQPKAGDYFLYCGASPSDPWVIGIPAGGAMRVKKLNQWFDVIIAGFKE